MALEADHYVRENFSDNVQALREVMHLMVTGPRSIRTMYASLAVQSLDAAVKRGSERGFRDPAHEWLAGKKISTLTQNPILAMMTECSSGIVSASARLWGFAGPAPWSFGVTVVQLRSMPLDNVPTRGWKGTVEVVSKKTKE